MNKQIQDIWNDLHQELKKFIFTKIADPTITDDILQEAFIKIHLQLHTLKDASKLTSWVYQITRNTVTDYYRKNRWMSGIEGLDLAEQAYEEPQYAALSTCINRKINQLPENYKQAILLTYFDQFSQIELAEKLNISYSGAKTRVQRGREQLKDQLLACKNLS
jgi:RNA polymerase sigma-70 factor (ECF subfamily)